MTHRIRRRMVCSAVRFGRVFRSRLRAAVAGDSGMTTVEYAVGTLVAAALAAVLYKIVTGQSILDGLTTLVTRALGVV